MLHYKGVTQTWTKTLTYGIHFTDSWNREEVNVGGIINFFVGNWLPKILIHGVKSLTLGFKIKKIHKS